MAKRRRRRPFETQERQEVPVQERPERFIDRDRGVFGFFRDFGVRETVESVIVAVVLALLFRAYEAEAFIIPTGSMAPTLQGQHMDVVCSECKYQYRTNAQDGSSVAPGSRRTVATTYCPVCRHNMRMSQKTNPDHRSNQGDRILVNKFIYDFSDPQRWDVIVFKNPNNGKQNYIKRLVGLPGDNLYIENGDLYDVRDPLKPKGPRTIIRKPPEKVRVMLQLVDDTDHFAKRLQDAGWPRRWDCRDKANDGWSAISSNDQSHYGIQPTEDYQWLRYRHLVPKVNRQIVMGNDGNWVDLDESEWDQIREGSNRPLERVAKSKGELIRDYYEYNDAAFERYAYNTHRVKGDPSAAPHWVGDLAFECQLEIDSKDGTVALDLVEGGAHYTCEIDVATGQATLKCSDSSVVFDSSGDAAPTGQTGLRGPGNYKIMYANVDDQVHLWINNQVVDFGGSTYTRGSENLPKYSADDPGDAEPAGIACKGVSGKITRLKLLRDVYYTAATGNNIGYDLDGFSVENYKPNQWSNPDFISKFRRMREQNERVYTLRDGQYLPMGDNSPSSLDGRVWPGEKFVSEDMLIGRAMFIYWPHSLNRPVKFFPNFKRMGFIK